jgi:hypothetical protein
VWENERTNSFFLDLALTGMGINVALMIYLTLYLPYIAKIEEDWETYCPQLIPVMTFGGVVSFLCAVIGLWPIWGFLTIIYMVILFLGYTMAMTFLPGGLIGTLLFWTLTFGMAFINHLMPHEAVW